MELDVNHNTNLSTLPNNDMENFAKELSENLEMKDLLIYTLPTDNGEFTNENLIKLEEKYNEIIKEFAKENNMDKIYLVMETNKNYNVVREYDAELDKITDWQLTHEELPPNCKEGLVLIKENKEYLIDKELTQNLCYKMKEYETNLLNEQQKYLKKMRNSGGLYYVKNIERRL